MAGATLRVGCCGYTVSKKKYHETFDLVEIQQTFYQLPRPETAEKWKLEAPERFEFTMKVWQLITHEPSSPTYRRLKESIPQDARERYGRFRPTGEVFEAWRRTLQFAKLLGASVIVFQCPASFRPTEENVSNLRSFFGAIERDSLRLAWEPRGAWPPELVSQLCAELDLIHCVDPLKDSPVTKGMTYFRLHGKSGYRYVHTEKDFDEILAKVHPGAVNYVLFNNVQMFDDAQRFREYARQRGFDA